MNFSVVLALIAKNTIYGLSIFFVGDLTENIDVLDVLALRFLLSSVVMFLLKITGILKIKMSVRQIFKGTTPHRKEPLLTGLFEPILYMFFETIGISMTTGITAGIILAMAPISSCFFEWLFLREKSTFLQKVFLAIGIVGVIYIAVNMNTTDGEDTLSGIIFMFLAVVSGSLYSVFSRKSSKSFGSLDITYITCIEGTLIFNFVNIIKHLINGDILNYFTPYFNRENIIGFIYLSVISTIFAVIMQNYSLSKAKPSSISAFSGISTLVTISVGILFLNEKIFMYHIIGTALIFIRMIGVTVIDIKKSRQ